MLAHAALQVQYPALAQNLASRVYNVLVFQVELDTQLRPKFAREFRQQSDIFSFASSYF